jgi:hypothetical protein
MPLTRSGAIPGSSAVSISRKSRRQGNLPQTKKQTDQEEQKDKDDNIQWVQQKAPQIVRRDITEARYTQHQPEDIVYHRNEEKKKQTKNDPCPISREDYFSAGQAHADKPLACRASLPLPYSAAGTPVRNNFAFVC